jgi:hypothetical protein
MTSIIREVLLSSDEGFTQRYEINSHDGFSGSIMKNGKDVPVRYDVDADVWVQDGMSQEEIAERVVKVDE